MWLEKMAYPELNDPSEIILDPTCSPATKGYLSLRDEIDAFLLLDPSEPVDVLEAAARSCCDRFRQVVLVGHIPPENILATFTEIWDGLNAIYGASSMGRELYLELCSALITGVSGSRVLEPGLFDASFWRAVAVRLPGLGLDEQVYGLFVQIMSRMSKLAFNDEVCEVWHLIMSHVPVTAMSEISEGVLSMLDAVFSVWASSTESTLISRMPSLFVVDPSATHTPEEIMTDIPRLVDPQPAKKFGNLLRPLELPNATMRSHLGQLRAVSLAMRLVSPEDQAHKRMLDAATQMVLEIKTDSRTVMHSLRYNWLCVLAQIPGVRQDYLFDTIARLEYKDNNAVDLVSNADLCTLLLLQWNSRGYLRTRESMCRTYDYWFCRTEGDTALVSLGYAVWETVLTEHFPMYFFSIWKVLGVLGRVDQMGDAIESVLLARRENPLNAAFIIVKFGLRFLETVAWTSYNHIVALRIFYLYQDYMPQHHSRLRQWNPQVWETLYLHILQDEKLPVGLLWEVLEMDKYESAPVDTGRLRNQHHGYYGDRRAKIVRKALPKFLELPRLSDRMALRHTSQCIRFLEQHRNGVTPKDILVLYEAVVKSLKTGRAANKSRLWWLAAVIKRNYGKEVAARSRTALLAWQKQVKLNAAMLEEPPKLELGEVAGEEGLGEGERLQLAMLEEQVKLETGEEPGEESGEKQEPVNLGLGESQ